MKILFVCRANVGRSQMAAEFYNQLHPGEADSAGTIVDLPGQKLKDRRAVVEVVEAMKEIGVDMSENIRKQLTPQIANNYDKIIALCEPETMPEYMKNSQKLEIWDVEDAMEKPMDKVRKIRDQIKELVADLAKRSHS